MSSTHDSRSTTKERAAAARAAAEAADRRRQRMIMGFGALGVAVLVGLIIGGALWSNASRTSAAAAGSSVTLPAVDASAALPATVLGTDSPQKYGVPFGSSQTAPLIEVWEDFQCPICADFEARSGPALHQLAADGTIRLVLRPATFLDKGFPESDLSSARATSAWGCAIDAGVGADYHSAVFANQPVTEGTGFTDEQLVGFGTQAGLSGAAATSFATCVEAHTYLGWAVNAEQAFIDSGVPGTPNVSLDGTELPDAVVQGPSDALVAYIEGLLAQ